MARAARVFINYRQADSLGHAGRVYDALAERFGRDRVFRDIPAIPPGVDWARFIADQLSACGAVVAVIGPRWLSVRSKGMRRLDQADDTLRRELAYALASDIAVLPVLVAGAPIPRPDQLPPDLRPLAARQALTLHEDAFDHGLERLAERLEELFSADLRARTVVASVRDPAGWLVAVATALANMLLGGPPWVAVVAGVIVLVTWVVADQVIERRAFRSSRSHR